MLNSKVYKWVTRSLSILIAALLFVRIFDGDVIDSVVGLKFSLLSPSMTAFITILRWLAYFVAIIGIVVSFTKIKSFKLIYAFGAPVSALFNLIFIKQHMQAFLGSSYSFTSYRFFLFLLEIVAILALSVFVLWQVIEERKEYFTKKMAWQAPLAAVLLFFLSVPASAPQILIGYCGKEVKDFSIVHRFLLYAAILMPVAVYFGLRKFDKDIKWGVLLTMSLIMFLQYYSPMDFHDLDYTNLPLHLCNMATLLILISYAFKVKPVYYFTFFVNVIGALFALFMPTMGGDFFNMSTFAFFFYHSMVFYLPILGMVFGIFERPNLKMMRGAIYIFAAYFMLMIIANAWINSFDSVDYFFLAGDKITEHLTMFRPIRLNYILAIKVKGLVYQTSWLYDIIFFVVYVLLMFLIWLCYLMLFKVQDHYTELLALRKADALEIAKLKKQLAGRPLSEPINKEGVNMINIEGFSKIYGLNKHKSVDNLSMQINDGEVFGFLGHNGAGKSTLIKSLVGIQSITEGKIEICGFDIAKQPLEAKMQIGYVSDNHAVYENLTGREYVNYVADLYNVSKEDRDERIAKYVSLFKIENAFDNQIKSYSHGMKQKIVVIAALVHKPKVWVLDEPLTGLDPTSAYQIKECMRQHADEGNIVFFSTHVIEVVEKICDRIAIISHGKLQGVFAITDLQKAGVELEQLYLAFVEEDEEKQIQMLKKIKDINQATSSASKATEKKKKTKTNPKK